MEESETLDNLRPQDTEETESRIDLPDINVYLVISIFALLTCLIFIGIILAGITLKRTRDYREYVKLIPHRYTAHSIQKSDTARILALTALIVPIPFYGIVFLLNIVEILEYFL